ncbi:MAG: hypothetical protein COA56_15080, partial [Dehalococcoidia bacterium]
AGLPNTLPRITCRYSLAARSDDLGRQPSMPNTTTANPSLGNPERQWRFTSSSRPRPPTTGVG